MKGPVIFFSAAGKWNGASLLSIPELISIKTLWRARVKIPLNLLSKINVK